MRHFFFSLFIMLFVGTMSCQAYSKQLLKANKALMALYKNEKATLKDQQKVVDMLNAVINTTSDAGDKCEASLELAGAYSEQVPVQLRDYAKAADYYKKALELICEKYNSDADDEFKTIKDLKYRAFYNTALYCYYRKSPTQDFGKALEYLLVAADYNPLVNGLIGEIYEFGLGCDINPTLASEYYTKAIQNGDDLYAKYYGVEYFINQITNGKGDDNEQASSSLDTLAFNNFRDGVLETKMGIERPDYAKVKQCLTIAAERGYLPAQYELGTDYMNGVLQGDSLTDNNTLAEKWLKKAADAGYIIAMHNLASLYEKMNQKSGKATEAGFIKAFPYYERAANGGFPPAQCAMAVYYYNGFGGKEKNLELTEFWLEQSASKGYRRAQDYLSNLKSEIAFKESQKNRPQQSTAEVLNSLANSLNSLARTLAGISSKQQNMTVSQLNRMRSSSYSNGRKQTNTVSNDNTVDKSALIKKAYERQKRNMDYVHVQTERKVYEDYEDMLKKMYWGNSTYRDRDRKNYQDKMREIRQKWEAKGFKICFSNGGKSEWETWDGKCKYYKK